MSTEKMDKLSRILLGLKKAGVEKGERNKLVASKTGYSVGTINRILSGNSVLTDRFIQAVCSGFEICKEWIENGQEPILNPINSEARSLMPGWEILKTLEENFEKSKIGTEIIFLDGVYQQCRAIGVKEICIEGFKELQKMPEAYCYKAVAMLKEMNTEGEIEKYLEIVRKIRSEGLTRSLDLDEGDKK